MERPESASDGQGGVRRWRLGGFEAPLEHTARLGHDDALAVEAGELAHLLHRGGKVLLGIGDVELHVLVFFKPST